jgi:hypothetical protein
MVKHPKQLDFVFGLDIRIGRPAVIKSISRDAQKVCDVVYVALLPKGRRSLKKGDVLKIGQTERTLEKRWKGIAGIFKPGRRLRKNERLDRDKWLKAAKGKDVSVWMRQAGRFTIPYAKGLKQSVFSSRGAEEEFLDEYYVPKLGRQLGSRASRERNLEVTKIRTLR